MVWRITAASTPKRLPPAVTINVLTDSELWLELHRRNRIALETHFSWDAVAAQFVQVLGLP
jgi:hypothetical protein